MKKSPCLVFFDKHILNHLFLLVDDPQALYVNAGCFKCISGMNLYPPNESFLIVYFSFYILKRISPTTGM